MEIVINSFYALGQEKKKNLLKNSLQCKDSSSIQTKKNEIIKTINNLEEE